MTRTFRKSFRGRIFFALLAASLIPLILCSVLLYQGFLSRLEQRETGELYEYLENVTGILDSCYDGFLGAGLRIGENPRIADALEGKTVGNTTINNIIFRETDDLRGEAVFELYDAEGVWRYSTERTSGHLPLSVDWGVLRAARERGGMVLDVTVDAADENEPSLLLAEPIYSRQGNLSGYLVIEMYRKHLEELLDGKYGSRSELILLNRRFRPVYSVDPGLAGEVSGRLREELLSGGVLPGYTEDFRYAARESEKTGLVSVIRRPRAFTGETLRLLYGVSAAVAAFAIALAVTLSLLVSRTVGRPVEKLHEAMQEVSKDNLDVRVEIQSEDELGELSDRFNRMLLALRTNREELLKNQKELDEAQIRMLQAQLNPHFLANTLDTMKWIAKINKVPQVAVMSTDLAEILRFAISPEELVTLGEELTLLDRYTEIQQIRLSGKLTVKKEVPEELYGLKVPKMMLQPIVENAILHGMDGAGDGEITVRASREKDKVTIAVLDSGKGLPPEMTGPYRAPENRDRHHLGLYNVDTILKKHYGKEYGLTLENTGAGGAAVYAVIPWEEKNG